jgi:ATP-dependent helicase/nuclease subunit A
MTRAEERLVFSHTEPMRHGDAPSWWQRVQPFATPLDLSSAGAEADAAASEPMPAVRCLPAWQATTQAAPPPDAEALQARLGRAVHRVLEWATGPARGTAEAEAAQRAAAEFGLAAAHAATVARCAAAILGSAQCAPFFDAAALQWAGNEVDLADGDGALRIDRLVARAGATGTEWWVLDYKLAHQPQADQRLREQLARYRAAVQALQPHDRVRAAFVSGAGELIELP